MRQIASAVVMVLLASLMVVSHAVKAKTQEPSSDIMLVWDQMLGIFTAFVRQPNTAIGMDLGLQPGDKLVVQVLSGGVADQAGLKTGDILAKPPKDMYRPGITAEIAVRRGTENLLVSLTTRFHTDLTELIQPAVAKTPRKLLVGSKDTDDFKTITAALTAVRQGDEIAVGPGIYREQLLLLSGVTLSGSGAGLTRIESRQPLRLVNAVSVVVRNLSIATTKAKSDKDRLTAIQVMNSQSVQLSDCAVQATSGTLITVSRSADLLVTGCILQGSEKVFGISAANSWLSISDSTFNDLGIAIEVKKGGAAITGNGFDGNTLSIRAIAAQSIVRQNVITGSDIKKDICVAIAGCQSQIVDNIIRNCRFGIGSQNAVAAIENNSISENHDGISVFAGHVTIDRNAIYSNANNGIVVTVPDKKNPPKNQSATISGNTISLNKRNGIRAEQASGLRIVENVIEANSFGISTADSSIDIARNTIIYQKVAGVMVRAGSSVSVERNIVAFNKYGVAIDIDADAELAGNSVYGNIARKTHPLRDGNYLRLDRVRMSSGEALRVRIFPAYDLQGEGDISLEPEFVESGSDYGLTPGSDLADFASRAGQIGAVPVDGGAKVPVSTIAARAPENEFEPAPICN